VPTPISQVPTPIRLPPPRQVAIHTAMPIFRTLASLAASSGFKFSIIVSCASVPGSAAACSSLSSNQNTIPPRIQSPKTTHTAAAAPDCHRLARTSPTRAQFASRLQSGRSAAVDAQRCEAETGLLHPSRAQLRSELRVANGPLTSPLTLILNNKTSTEKRRDDAVVEIIVVATNQARPKKVEIGGPELLGLAWRESRRHVLALPLILCRVIWVVLIMR